MAAWQGQHEPVPDTPHEDQPLVRAMRNRSTDALTLVYDRYGPQLFDYCHAILRDEPYAARVVHDTLLAAEAHITQLPAPDKLRGWLYALARRECQRILRGPDRPTKRRPAPEAPDEFGTPQDRQRHHDARMLAHNALSALTGRQREAVDLTVRHGLTDTELAGVLAIPLEEAAALAEGSRDDLAEAVSGLVGHQRVQLSRLLAVMPIAMAPPNLESRILASALDPEMNAERAAIARRAMPFDSRGWPVESDQRQGHRAPADPDRTLVDRPSDDDERDGIPAFVWPTVGAAAVAALVAGLFLFDLSSDDGPSRDSTVVAASPSTSEDDEEVLDEEPSERPTKTKKPTQKPTEDPETPTSTPTPQPSTSSPTPTPKPTPTQVEPGQLVVGAGCTIGAQATQCSVPIAAKGGPVRWSAQGYGPISGGGSGLLKAGATRLVTFTVARADECVEGQIVINFTPAGSTTVAWMCPPVEPDPGDDGDDEPDPAAP